MVLANLRPSFGRKIVYILDCKECGELVCRRGMLAVLVADGKTQLFSTDKYDRSAVGVIPELYTTEKCQCKIQSLACLCCGSVVGYQVVYPCSKCLSCVNNGHLCMFHSRLVTYSHRLDEQGGGFMLWKQLKSPSEDTFLSLECIR